MARDGRKFGKDARDRARHQHAQRGGFRPVAGGTQREATVREATHAQRGTKTVTREDRYDLRVPHGLGDRVKGIHVKQDVVRTYDAATGAEVASERSTMPKLVIVFREHQEGIHGMPVPRAVANKQRKASFTHAVIQRIPPEAMDAAAERLPIDIWEERGFRLTCYTPKGGHKRRGHQGGEAVYDVTDELSVLQFLYEHDLLSLYTIPHLASRGFLPKRDAERVWEDSIAAQMFSVFGALAPRHQVNAFHWARLRHRLLIVYGGETMAAEAAFVATARGKQFCSGDARIAAVSADVCYYSEGCSLAYGVYFFPNFRAVVSYDIAQRTIIAIEPIPCDRTDAEQLDRFTAAFFANPNYRRVPWDEFRALVGGIGSATASA